MSSVVLELDKESDVYFRYVERFGDRYFFICKIRKNWGFLVRRSKIFEVEVWLDLLFIC